MPGYSGSTHRMGTRASRARQDPRRGRIRGEAGSEARQDPKAFQVKLKVVFAVAIEVFPVALSS